MIPKFCKTRPMAPVRRLDMPIKVSKFMAPLRRLGLCFAHFRGPFGTGVRSPEVHNLENIWGFKLRVARFPVADHSW
jgi:hypothetical protein